MSLSRVHDSFASGALLGGKRNAAPTPFYLWSASGRPPAVWLDASGRDVTGGIGWEDETSVAM